MRWPDLTKKSFAMLWHLRHWLQYRQLRTWIHDILCFVIWQLIVTLDSIRNSGDVFLTILFTRYSWRFGFVSIQLFFIVQQDFIGIFHQQLSSVFFSFLKFYWETDWIFMVRLHPAPLNQTSCLIFLCVPWFLINANQTSYLIFIYSLWFIFRHQMRLPYTLYLKPYTSYPGAVTSTPPSTRSCTPCATGRLFSADMQEGWLWWHIV